MPVLSGSPVTQLNKSYSTNHHFDHTYSTKHNNTVASILTGNKCCLFVQALGAKTGALYMLLLYVERYCQHLKMLAEHD